MREGENKIRRKLVEALKAENAFWSYQTSSVNEDSISDEILIAYTLRYLDLQEIDLLYKSFLPIKSIIPGKNISFLKGSIYMFLTDS